MKRMSSLVICVIMALIASFTMVSAKEYTDVEAGKWYSEPINYVSENGLMMGTSDNRFSPGLDVTRAQMAQILWNLAKNPSVDGKTDFVDVNENKWYNDAIDWVSTVGVMSGYGDNKFGPDDVITREQTAKVLHKYTMYLDIPLEGVLNKYRDANKISSWAQESMAWVVDRGVISGTSSTTLDPRGKTTRAQMATILANYCKNVATEHEWPEYYETFKDFDVVPTPDDLSGYDRPSSWLNNPDLHKFVKLDNGTAVYKFLGSTDVFPGYDSITLYVYKGTDRAAAFDNKEYTPYEIHPGEELVLGFPYGAGTYSYEAYCAGIYFYHGGTFEVSEEDVEKSSLASLTMNNYIYPSMVQMTADSACKNSKTDKEKAQDIFYWFCGHTKYDEKRVDEISWGYIPAYNKIIEDGSAICKDFAGMYVAMCRSQGLKARVCIGWTYYKEDDSQRGYHAWSEVWWDGEWHTVDPTAAASLGTGFWDLDEWMFDYDTAFNRIYCVTDYMY